MGLDLFVQHRLVSEYGLRLKKEILILNSLPVAKKKTYEQYKAHLGLLVLILFLNPMDLSSDLLKG